jgi:hypothetical protein
MITKFKLFETGEWSRDVNWQFVKDNPDNDSEEANWIKSFESKLKIIISHLKNPNIFKIIDINGRDMSQGPYATVKIFNRIYKIWTTPEDDLWIENFPIDNTSEEGQVSGFEGTPYDIARLLNDINQFGGDIETYKIAKKYNI